MVAFSGFALAADGTQAEAKALVKKAIAIVGCGAYKK